MALNRGATGAGVNRGPSRVQWAISSCRGIQCVLSGVGLPVSNTGETSKALLSCTEMGRVGISMRVFSLCLARGCRLWCSDTPRMLLELPTLHEARGLVGGQ